MDATVTTLPSTLKLKIDLTDEQFFQMCQKNRDYRFERTSSGELLIMPPTGSDTGRRNVKITTQLAIWNSESNLGEVFDSSTGFTLPNGAERSPDVSWIRIERWNALTPEQQEKFAPICPDFVVELRSPSDSLKDLQEKMQEYIENGAQLGWLIDRKNKRVEIYRPGTDVEILINPTSLSGENVLPGFVLNLQGIMQLENKGAIAIRTMVLRDNKVSVQAGAGLVADSDPEKEYEETLNKARGLLVAIRRLR